MGKFKTFIKNLWRRYEGWLQRWGLDQTSCSRCMPHIKEQKLARPEKPADKAPE